MEEKKINFCVDCVYMRDVTCDSMHEWPECVCRKNGISYVTGYRKRETCYKIRENKAFCEYFKAKPLKWYEKLFNLVKK